MDACQAGTLSCIAARLTRVRVRQTRPERASCSAQDRNESLFFHVLSENIEELLPIVHLPTVSQYCQTYGLMFKSLPRSLFISTRDRGAPRLLQSLCLLQNPRQNPIAAPLLA